MILLFTSFLLCLLVSTLNGKWGVRCQVFFTIHAGLVFGQRGVERLHNVLNESQHSIFGPNSSMSFILAGILMLVVATTIVRTPIEQDAKLKRPLHFVAATSITGLIIGLIGFFWLFGIPLALRIWRAGSLVAARYSQGGGSVAGFYHFLGLIVLLGILIPAILCSFKRRRLALLLAHRLIEPSPRKLHPGWAVLIILLICGLIEQFT